MLLVQASRDALLKPLTTVIGIVERRHTLLILSNILLRKEGSRISFIATDLEVQISTYADIGVGDEIISTTVAGRKLVDILRALPAGNDITLELEDEKLIVKSGGSRFELQTMAADDFPTLAPVQWETSFAMQQQTLKHLIHSAHFAMAHQDIRYYLNGMLFVFEPGWARVVATDGHRLVHHAAEVQGIDSQQEVIVPRKTVLELQRLLADTESPVQVEGAAGQLRFYFDEVEVISKLVEGKFPDYQRVIPTSYTRHFVMDREALQGSLQRAAILTTDKLRGVRIELGENQLKISATNAEQEQAREKLDVDYAYESLDVGFNVSYLLDVLANTKTDSVRWSVQPDSNASVLITLPEEDAFKYVVMPMRI